MGGGGGGGGGGGELGQFGEEVSCLGRKHPLHPPLDETLFIVMNWKGVHIPLSLHPRSLTE